MTVGVDRDSDALLLACSSKRPSPVMHVDARGHGHGRDLGWTVSIAQPGEERAPRPTRSELEAERWLGVGGAIADARTGAIRTPEHTDMTLLTGHVIAIDPSGLWLVDPGRASDIRLSSDIDGLGLEVLSGEVLAARTSRSGEAEILHLEAAVSLGLVEGAVVGVSHDGAALVATGGTDPFAVHEGPLRWVTPAPR